MCEILVTWVAYSVLHNLFGAALNYKSLPFFLDYKEEV